MSPALARTAAVQADSPIDEARDYIMIAKIEAASKGVPLAVTLRNGATVEHMTVDVASLRIDETNTLEFTGPGYFRRIPLSGQRAPAILPEIVPMDQRQQLMQAAAQGLARLREQSTVLMTTDGVSTCLVRSDLVLLNSTGIFPYGALGMEWDEVLSVSSQSSMLTISTPFRTLELRAS